MAAERVDLCVIGAGIAALNALAVASDYLGRDARVVLIERRARSGGMWIDTYPYVRLHQPHPLFTAASIPWEGGRDRDYLATREEVLDHFAHVVDVVRGRVDLDERYGWELLSHEERDGRVHVRVRDPGGAEHVLDAARLIKGFGLEIGDDLPLAVTSDRVRSIAPATLDAHRDRIGADGAPVWIIGSGKTGMDTAHRLVTECPDAEVHLLSGSGTFFTSRDKLFHRGRARWRPRRTPNMAVTEMARRFDGTNEDEVRRWYRETYGVGLEPDARNFFFGLLSQAERDTIARGLASLTPGYLDDVRDAGDGVELVLRSGAFVPAPAGTWLVNCTGLIRPVDRPYEPYTSPSGNVLNLSTRSVTALLSSFMGYYMTHLMFAGRLGDTPLYEIDSSELLRVAKPVAPYALASLAVYNLILLAEVLPARALLRCGLDLDRMVPAPHRIAAIAAFTAHQRRDRAHHQRALDTVRERFGVRCGPLEAIAA